MNPEATPDEKRELAAVISRFLQGQRDSSANRKAREDMNRMGEETRSRIGTVLLAVDLIREARNP